jgi:kynurenine formamidase
MLTVKDITTWEQKYGTIKDHSVVIMKTGWNKHFNTDKYVGQDAKKVYHFPGFSPEAATWLLKERSIVGIGLDTASLDYGPSAKYEVH